MAAGVAAGIRANTGSAVSAMASLVSQVNAEAKKAAKIHSPSRLLRDEVGKYLSLGVAEGISAHAYQATNAMSNVMAGVRNAANIKPLNFSFDANVLKPSVGSSLNVEPLLDPLSSITIEVPVNFDGREISRIIAKPMQQELDKRQLQNNRLKGDR